MLFTREELVEMGLLSPEVPSNSRQLSKIIGEFKPELTSIPRQLVAVATSELPGCKVVATENQQVATEQLLYIIYTYFSKLLGCKIINIHLRGLYEKYRVETIVLPSNPATEVPEEVVVSLWNRYSCGDFLPVAGFEALLQPKTVSDICNRIKNTHIYASLVQDWEYYQRYKAIPGDQWDGKFTDDGLPTMDESREITPAEILEAAEVERQRVRPGRTMLSLMYEYNVQDWTWFEGHDGQWHCFNNTGLRND